MALFTYEQKQVIYKKIAHREFLRGSKTGQVKKINRDKKGAIAQWHFTLWVM